MVVLESSGGGGKVFLQLNTREPSSLASIEQHFAHYISIQHFGMLVALLSQLVNIAYSYNGFASIKGRNKMEIYLCDCLFTIVPLYLQGV